MADDKAATSGDEKYRILLEATCTVLSDYDAVNDVMTVSAPQPCGMTDIVTRDYRRCKGAPFACIDGEDLFLSAITPALLTPQSGSFVYPADYGLGRRWYRASYISTADESGGVCRLLCMSVDITDEYNEKQRLRELACTDRATGLANKATAQLEICRNLLRPREDGEDALIMVDIDDFKLVNDFAGHSEGDRVLSEFAGLLRSTFRSSDVISRFGGDEFMIYLRGGSPRLARSKVASILRGVARITFCDNVRMGCSIGLVNIPAAEINFDRIFEQADYALYSAKRNGKNTCTVFDADSMGGGIKARRANGLDSTLKKQL